MMQASSATAHAPGSIGNLGPGLDVLGAALVGPYDSVTAEWTDIPGLHVLDSGHPELPNDPLHHASGIAAAEVMRVATTRDARFGAQGLALRVTKGLPLSAGQGGSAASAVAGALATNALLGTPLEADELLTACLLAESALAGQHLDNIAASLFGGICLVRSIEPIDVVKLPTPSRLRVVIAHPAQRLRTETARAVLPPQVDRSVVIQQMANVAAIVAACYSEDLRLLGRALVDHIAEPARSELLPGFAAAKAAALEAGALGSSISGAGPSAFALCDSDVCAQRVMHAMRDAYTTAGVEVAVRATRLDAVGARVDTLPLIAR
ncbi:MAG: homoserine kinase [Gemmatimonadota bacterium]